VLPPERSEKMTDLKPYYQVKLTLLRCKTYYLNNPPKTEDEKYAYNIIQKAYWINEKKIEMLDFQKDKKLLEDYYEYRKVVTKCKK
jgi:hypothetical protein